MSMPLPWRERVERLPSAWLAALLAGFAFLVYAGAIPSGFVFDDEFAILGSPVVQGTVPLGEAFVRDFWGRLPGAPNAIGTYRPLPVLLLALEWRLGGGAAWVMHLGNVLWHSATIALFFLAFAPRVGRRLAFVAAALAAVLCAPSEAVQALVGRADLMCAFFVLLALCFHGRQGAGATVAAAVSFGLALGSKESAIAALPAFWVLDRLVRAGSPPRLGRYVTYGLVTGGYLLLRSRAVGAALRPTIDPQSNPLLQAAPLEQMLGAGRVFLERYVAGIVAPGRRLYECSAMACGPASADDVVAWAGVALALLLALSPLLLWRRAPRAAAGLAWFVIFFLPVSNFLVLSPSLYGERLLYLPLFGAVLALVDGADALARRVARPALAWGIVAALGLANLAALQVRHLDWRTDLALYASGLELADTSAKVHKNVAVALMKAEEWVPAELHARRSLELWPGNVTTRSLLGMSLAMQGRTQEAEAEFRQALTVNQAGEVVCPFAVFLARQQRFAEALELVRAHAERVARAPVCTGLTQQLEAAAGGAR
ncbi:glycosyltransferase family 39 protein [Pyxidicoccus trucidator]|uniref:glycosyltransferase family 39 protein n=1 Tax=Pyxidicoccus trucidator TaxID=2709662 RepID=UPI0013DC4050|nr:glycosyltransferase family 39 protein [Pyxidicoccus trucidator]